MLHFRARWLPVLLPLLILLTFVITYSIAVRLNHVYPFWPYISDTGTLPPESCVFSLFLNIVCWLEVGIIYVRHLQVSQFSILRPYIRISHGWNRASTTVGLIGAAGLAIVANFQETNELLTHVLGALCCFIFSTIYFLIQCVFTYKMKYATKLIFWLRVVFTCVNAISLITVFAPIKAAMDRFKGKNVLLWTPKDGGYGYHLASTISEWILVTSFCLYLLTFYWEFKKFEATEPDIKFLEQAESEGSDKSRDRRSSFRPATSQWV